MSESDTHNYIKPGGRKDDDGKMRLDLIPPEAFRALGAVLTYGAKKYEPRNWEKGIERDRVLGALYRHIVSYLEGEIKDTESGLPHLDHAFCNAMFLAVGAKRGWFDAPNPPKRRRAAPPRRGEDWDPILDILQDAPDAPSR